MDEADLRVELEAVLRKTASADKLSGGGFWVGDAAGERRVLDDLKAGRLNWKAAHGTARSGLDLLDAGDAPGATLHLIIALNHCIDALEIRAARARGADKGALNRPAKKRGRPKKIK